MLARGSMLGGQRQPSLRPNPCPVTELVLELASGMAVSNEEGECLDSYWLLEKVSRYVTVREVFGT